MSRSRPALLAIVGILALASASTAPTRATAQSLWMQRGADHAVMLEMLRPNLEGVNQELFSGAFFLSGRTTLASRVTLVGELPYLRHASSFKSTDFLGTEITVKTTSNTIGDPYLGMEARLSDLAFLELGFRPPLASEEEFEAELTGYFTDVTRFGAFLPNVASIQAAINLREVTPSKMVYRVRLSPMVAIPTKDYSDFLSSGDTEVFACYSFQIGYDGSTARIGAGMSGLAQITEDYPNLGARTRNQFELHADFLRGAIRPGLDLHLPLGDEASFIPDVLGVSVSWTR